VQADRLALLANFGLFGFALASFDRADGALLWSRAVATTAVFTDRAFTASEDRLFVAGSESSFYPFVLPVSPIGALFAFDAGTGADAWSLAPGTTVDDLALRAERLFFPVGTTGWDLRAVDAATGAPLWSEVLPGGSAQRVAVGPAGLFAAGRLGGDLHLRAHEPASGALLWEGFGGLGTRTAARELLVTEGRLHVVASTMSHGLVVQTWRTRSGAFVRSRALGGSYERVSGTVDSGVLAVLGGTGPPFTSASEAFAPWRLTALRGR
jgi:outer membrane protein assembly factor BamB